LGLAVLAEPPKPLRFRAIGPEPEGGLPWGVRSERQRVSRILGEKCGLGIGLREDPVIRGRPTLGHGRIGRRLSWGLGPRKGAVFGGMDRLGRYCG
jgi:hypothetical protein